MVSVEESPLGRHMLCQHRALLSICGQIAELTVKSLSGNGEATELSRPKQRIGINQRGRVARGGAAGRRACVKPGHCTANAESSAGGYLVALVSLTLHLVVRKPRSAPDMAQRMRWQREGLYTRPPSRPPRAQIHLQHRSHLWVAQGVSRRR